MVFFNSEAKIVLPTAIILLLSSLISLSSGDELCTAIGQPKDPSSTTISSTDTSISDSSYCVKYFTIDLTNTTYKGKYVLIELQLTSIPSDTNINYFDPALIGKLGSIPTIDKTSYGNSQFDQNDPSGSIFRKDYHYIELLPNYTKDGGIYNIAFYRNFTDNYYAQSINYSIKATANDKYMCPRSCSGKGVCNLENHVCECNSGFYDTDCSIPATLIKVPGQSSVTILPRNWTFFYFFPQDIEDTFELVFQGNTFPLNLYDMDTTSDFNNLSVLALTKVIEIPVNTGYPFSDNSDDDDGDENNIQILGFYNTNNANVSITYQAVLSASSNSTSVVMTIIISILAFFIVVTILVIICKLRQLKRLRQRAEQIQVAQLQTQATPQFLTPDQIDQYFPKNLYKKTRNHFQSSCSICLEDFQPDSSCRRLYCGHVYHDICIEEWLRKHDKCPNCNKEMTLAAINEFVKNPFILSPNSKIQSMTFDFKNVGRTTNRLQTQPNSPILSPGALQYQRQRQETQEQDQERAEIQRNHNRTTSIDPLVQGQSVRQGSFDLNPIVIKVATPNEIGNGN